MRTISSTKAVGPWKVEMAKLYIETFNCNGVDNGIYQNDISQQRICHLGSREQSKWNRSISNCQSVLTLRLNELRRAIPTPRWIYVNGWKVIWWQLTCDTMPCFPRSLPTSTSTRSPRKKFQSLIGSTTTGLLALSFCLFHSSVQGRFAVNL